MNIFDIVDGGSYLVSTGALGAEVLLVERRAIGLGLIAVRPRRYIPWHHSPRIVSEDDVVEPFPMTTYG